VDEAATGSTRTGQKPPLDLGYGHAQGAERRSYRPHETKERNTPAIANGDELSGKKIILIVAHFHFHAATLVAHHSPRRSPDRGGRRYIFGSGVISEMR